MTIRKWTNDKVKHVLSKKKIITVDDLNQILSNLLERVEAIEADQTAYIILHLDPKPGAEWKPIEEHYLRNAIGCQFSPWPEHRLDEREERITQEIQRYARTGDVFTHTSRDKYRVFTRRTP